ncbi:MAG: hypothetical protein IPK82_38485 [Polyangiaceae bacterium]|nr:hypothetical protein [Polyangiaceae bacterium]
MGQLTPLPFFTRPVPESAGFVSGRLELPDLPIELGWIISDGRVENVYCIFSMPPKTREGLVKLLVGRFDALLGGSTAKKDEHVWKVAGPPKSLLTLYAKGQHGDGKQVLLRLALAPGAKLAPPAPSVSLPNALEKLLFQGESFGELFDAPIGAEVDKLKLPAAFSGSLPKSGVVETTVDLDKTFVACRICWKVDDGHLAEISASFNGLPDETVVYDALLLRLKKMLGKPASTAKRRSQREAIWTLASRPVAHLRLSAESIDQGPDCDDEHQVTLTLKPA